MTRRRIAVAGILVLVLGPLAGLLWVETSLGKRQSTRPAVGDTFPFLAGIPDSASLPTAPGRTRVVVFARAGCGNCDRTITTLRRMARDEDPAFDLIAVVAGSSEPGALDGEMLAIADPEASLSKRFGVLQVPLVFLVDEASTVLAVATGERPEAAWRSFLGNASDAR